MESVGLEIIFSLCQFYFPPSGAVRTFQPALDFDFRPQAWDYTVVVAQLMIIALRPTFGPSDFIFLTFDLHKCFYELRLLHLRPNRCNFDIGFGGSIFDAWGCVEVLSA